MTLSAIEYLYRPTISVGDRVRYHGYIGTVSSIFQVRGSEKFGIRFDGDDDETLWFDAYNDADAIIIVRTPPPPSAISH